MQVLLLALLILQYQIYCNLNLALKEGHHNLGEEPLQDIHNQSA
jgi:hypothetical protein